MRFCECLDVVFKGSEEVKIAFRFLEEIIQCLGIYLDIGYFRFDL